MKYVMVGPEESFDFLGIRSAKMHKNATVPKIVCKLENGYILHAVGDKVSSSVASFLISDVPVLVVRESDPPEDSTDFIELYDPVGEIVTRVLL